MYVVSFHLDTPCSDSHSCSWWLGHFDRLPGISLPVYVRSHQATLRDLVLMNGYHQQGYHYEVLVKAVFACSAHGKKYSWKDSDKTVETRASRD
jgi:hypothetical protein